MAVIGRSAHTLPASGASFASWSHRFNAQLDALTDTFFNALMGWLCRASRGYLCPPDMPSVMYPESSNSPDTPLSGSRTKECCNEKLPGK
jgi:hypothetical protein